MRLLHSLTYCWGGMQAEAVLAEAPVTYTESLAQLMLHLKLFSVG
jgi:hypothetical protein